MSAALLLWAMYFLQRDAMPWFWIMALLAAATKEEVGLLIALFGVPLLLRHRVQGAIALVAGIAWFLIAVMVIIPHFNPGGQSPYLARYGYLGSGLHGIIAGMLRHPDLVWRTLSSASRVTYLDALLDPVGFVALPGLPVFLLSAPALVINMLSTDSTMYSGFYQYSAEIVPYIVAASVAGVCVVDRGATRAWHGELLAPLACALVLVASAVATRVYGFTPLSEGYVVPSVGQHQRTEQRLIGAIPPGAVVAAADEVEPHLADRRTVYLLPTVHPANGPPAEYIALDASIPALPIEPSVLRAAAVRALRNGYGVQAADEGVLVLRRGAPRRQLPRSFYIFMFGLGRRTTPERASWGPLHLVGVTIHPSYGWVNRSRPAVEVETYWRVFRTLPPGVEVRLSASPVDARSTASFGSWTAVEDSPTWDWLPLDRWPVHRTVHAALIPITLPTERAGTVRLAIAVAGLGHVHGLTAAQRIPGSFTALRIGTIDVRP
jgi:hypothetical protein